MRLLLLMALDILILPLEYLSVFWQDVLGLRRPVLHSHQMLRGRWKMFCGRKIDHIDLTVVNGYMYNEMIFDDGTSILYRGDFISR